MRSTLDALDAELREALEQQQQAAVALSETNGLDNFHEHSAASQELSAAEKRVAKIQQRITEYKACSPLL